MKVIKLFLIIEFILCLLVMNVFAETKPVGMVLDLQGNGEVISDGNTTKLQLLSFLKPQMRVKVQEGSKASLSLYSKRMVYQVIGPAEVEILKDKLNVISGSIPISKVIAEKLVTAAEPSKITAGAYRMRGELPQISIVTPENGSVLLELQPRFIWEAMESSKYVIQVFDQTKQLVMKDEVLEQSWQIPPGKFLNYGKSYKWAVSFTSAKNGKENVASGEFTVLTKNEAENLIALKPSASASIEEWVLYAVMLENKKAREAAHEVWKKIAQDRPDLEKVAELAR
ncbi:MAG: hypothetical protein ACAH10_14995 [Methylophilaceae bacterium]